jgi:hypothetical protein
MDNKLDHDIIQKFLEKYGKSLDTDLEQDLEDHISRKDFWVVHYGSEDIYNNVVSDLEEICGRHKQDAASSCSDE